MWLIGFAGIELKAESLLNYVAGFGAEVPFIFVTFPVESGGRAAAVWHSGCLQRQAAAVHSGHELDIFSGTNTLVAAMMYIDYI